VRRGHRTHSIHTPPGADSWLLGPRCASCEVLSRSRGDQQSTDALTRRRSEYALQVWVGTGYLRAASTETKIRSRGSREMFHPSGNAAIISLIHAASAPGMVASSWLASLFV